MGVLIIANNDVIISAGHKRRLWWSAKCTKERVQPDLLPIDIALCGVAMGRWVAVTREEAAKRPAAVAALITSGFAHDVSELRTLRDVVMKLPHGSRKN